MKGRRTKGRRTSIPKKVTESKRQEGKLGKGTSRTVRGINTGEGKDKVLLKVRKSRQKKEDWQSGRN